MLEVKNSFSIQLKVENNQTILNDVLLRFSRRRIDIHCIYMSTSENYKLISLTIESDYKKLFEVESQLKSIEEIYEVKSNRII